MVRAVFITLHAPSEENTESEEPTPIAAPTPPTSDKYTVTPQRIKVLVGTMTRNDAMKILNVGIGCSDREIRRNYRLLARKYHPDKWCDRCLFTKREGEEIFKKLANAYNKLGGNM